MKLKKYKTIEIKRQAEVCNNAYFFLPFFIVQKGKGEEKMEKNREEIRKRLEEMLKGNEEIRWADNPQSEDDYKVIDESWILDEVALDEFAVKTGTADKENKQYTERTINLIESFGYNIEVKLTNATNGVYEVFVERRY